MKTTFGPLFAKPCECRCIVSVRVNVKAVPRPLLGVGQRRNSDESSQSRDELKQVVVEWGPFPVGEVRGLLDEVKVPQYAWDVDTDPAVALRIRPHLNVGIGDLHVGRRVGDAEPPGRDLEYARVMGCGSQHGAPCGDIREGRAREVAHPLPTLFWMSNGYFGGFIH